jgi:hypothetical protein
MMSLTRGLQSLQKQVDVQTNVEIPSAALTLTRSATLAITTAGTIITWQTETRNQGFTWATDTITMPTTGYYAVQTFLQTAGNVTLFTQRQINGTNIGYFGWSPVAVNYHVGTMVRYFTTGDTLQIRVAPSANTTLNVAADGVGNESPFLHIVQLSGSV